MNGWPSQAGIFSQWYTVLVRSKMPGPALCVAGMSTGFALVQLSRTAPEPYHNDVARAGVLLIDGSSWIFLVITLILCVVWLRGANKRSDSRTAVTSRSKPPFPADNTRTKRPKPEPP